MAGRGKRLRERTGRITYMQTSLGLFGLAFVLCIFLGIRAVKTGGALTLLDGFLGLLSLAGSAAGFFIPLYGRFIVGEPDKPDYRIGLALNGLLMLWMIFLYFLGL